MSLFSFDNPFWADKVIKYFQSETAIDLANIIFIGAKRDNDVSIKISRMYHSLQKKLSVFFYINAFWDA